jgi:hypothetical protein
VVAMKRKRGLRDLGLDPETHVSHARVMERELRKLHVRSCDDALDALDVAVTIREHRIAGGDWKREDTKQALVARANVRKFCGCGGR